MLQGGEIQLFVDLEPSILVIHTTSRNDYACNLKYISRYDKLAPNYDSELNRICLQKSIPDYKWDNYLNIDVMMMMIVLNVMHMQQFIMLCMNLF